MEHGIVRRRKRSAVDPCLGYYRETNDKETIAGAESSINSPVNGTKSTRTSKRPSTSKRIASVNQTRKESERAQFSVEDFLRSNAKRVPKKPCSSKGKAADHENALSKRPSSPIESLETDPALNPTKDNEDALLHSANTSRNAEEGSARDETPDHPSLAKITVLEDDHSSEDDSEPAIPTRSRVMRRQIIRDTDSESGDGDPEPGKSSPQPRRSRLACARRIIRDSELYSSISEDGADSDFSKVTPPAASRAKGKQKGPLKTKSLGTRLFDASVSTNGKPLDSLVVPPLAKATGQMSTRRPLEFVPIDNGPPHAGPSRKRNTLRQTEPSRNATFGGRSKGKAINLEQGPPKSSYKSVSSWMPKHDFGPQHTQPTPTVKRAKRVSKGPPRRVTSGTVVVGGVYPPSLNQ